MRQNTYLENENAPDMLTLMINVLLWITGCFIVFAAIYFVICMWFDPLFFSMIDDADRVRVALGTGCHSNL